jgi:hypothetical protein
MGYVPVCYVELPEGTILHPDFSHTSPPISSCHAGASNARAQQVAPDGPLLVLPQKLFAKQEHHHRYIRGVAINGGYLKQSSFFWICLLGFSMK